MTTKSTSPCHLKRKIEKNKKQHTLNKTNLRCLGLPCTDHLRGPSPWCNAFQHLFIILLFVSRHAFSAFRHSTFLSPFFRIFPALLLCLQALNLFEPFLLFFWHSSSAFRHSTFLSPFFLFRHCFFAFRYSIFLSPFFWHHLFAFRHSVFLSPIIFLCVFSPHFSRQTPLC